MGERRATTSLEQRIGAHPEADDDDEGAQETGPQVARPVGSAVATDDSAGSHRGGEREVDVAPDEEGDGRDGVDRHGGEVFEPVGAADVTVAEQADGGEHEDADAGAEEAAVGGD